jgi:alkanesulfonate monooxygenase SsuD/methylene tetrahydromethanopterin reductase-like flavin-dependent oxidoreductase (luciferase family)/YHS domain-containing protein
MPFRRQDGSAPTIQDLMQRAGLIEDLGFDGIWIGDTVGRWNTTGIDTLQWLLACSAGTQRIELGTAVLVVPLRYPVELAQRILSLYALSGGRFSCAVGSGSLPLDFVAVGIDHSQRFRLFSEGVRTIKALLNGETVGTANIHPWPDVAGKPPIIIASWYNGPWIRRAARGYQGWVASGLNSTFAELREGIKRYRDEGGKRALVATVGVNFAGTSPPLSDDTNFNLRCPYDEAKERVERLGDLGFDDLLLTAGTSFAAEDVPEEMLAQIVSLRPEPGRAGTRPLEAGLAPHREERPRAKDPVCLRFIELTTMTSPTSRQVFKVDYAGQEYYLCSSGCKEAFERNPAAYVR